MHTSASIKMITASFESLKHLLGVSHSTERFTKPCSNELSQTLTSELVSLNRWSNTQLTQWNKQHRCINLGDCTCILFWQKVGAYYELDVYKEQSGRKSQLSKIQIGMPLEGGGTPGS